MAQALHEGHWPTPTYAYMSPAYRFFRLHLFNKYFVSPALCRDTMLDDEDTKAVRHERYRQGAHGLGMGTVEN